MPPFVVCLQHGMSIGIADTVADNATMRTINDIIEKVGQGDGGGGATGQLGKGRGKGLHKQLSHPLPPRPSH